MEVLVEYFKMVMKEYDFPPSDPRAQEVLFQQPDKFFLGEGAQLPPRIRA